jgi:hypothetical protein
MKKVGSVLLAVSMTFSLSAFAQGRGSHGKPAMTGIERAESVANSHGDKGLENAESKQAKHKKHKSKKHKPSKSERGSAN